MNTRLKPIGRHRPHSPLRLSSYFVSAFAFALLLAAPTPAAASGAAPSAPATVGVAAADAGSTTVTTEVLPGLAAAQRVDGVAGAPANPSPADGVPLTGASDGSGVSGATGNMDDLIAGGFEPLPEGAAAADGVVTGRAAAEGTDGTAAAYAPYVERAWTTDRYGRPQSRLARGDGARLYFTAVNPAWNWQVAYLRLAVRQNIVCFRAPCDAAGAVLAQGYKWFPPGRATYYLPVVVERNDPLGNWIFDATVGDTAARADFEIVDGVWTDPAASGVVLYDGAEFTGRTVVVGAGAWQLPSDFRPRSLRFVGAFAAGWRMDLEQTICPFVPPCFYQRIATYDSDQVDLGNAGMAPFRVSVHR